MNKKQIRQNKEKGITLIALVITIIVMLILVAVTVTMAINGGLFNYAGRASKETKNAIAEEGKLAEGGVKVNDQWYNSIEEYLETIKGQVSDGGEEETPGLVAPGAVLTDGTVLTWEEFKQGYAITDTAVDMWALSTCDWYKSIVFPEGITSIGDGAFEGCPALTRITLPSSLESLGGCAFYGTSLITINFNGTMAQWDAISKGEAWNGDSEAGFIPATEVVCSDGTVTL